MVNNVTLAPIYGKSAKVTFFVFKPYLKRKEYVDLKFQWPHESWDCEANLSVRCLYC